MNERQPTSLAAHPAPAPRAVLGRLAPGLAALALGLLAGCGQKGPLYFPSASGTQAHPAAPVPSAPDGAISHGPVAVPSPPTR
jgi:predicted small lipoprotein YifL